MMSDWSMVHVAGAIIVGWDLLINDVSRSRGLSSKRRREYRVCYDGWFAKMYGYMTIESHMNICRSHVLIDRAYFESP